MNASTDPIDFSARWARYLDALRGAGELTFGDAASADPLLEAEAFRYLLRLTEFSHFIGIEMADRNYPHLARMFSTYQQLGNMNPDCLYLHAQIDGSQTYRISGTRGNAHLFEVSTMDSHMLAHPDHKELTTLTGIEADPHGNVEVVLSPEPHEGYWIETGPEASWIYVRQYFYDWENESPANLVIERVGASWPPPPPAAADMEQWVDRLVSLLPGFSRSLANFAQSYRAAPANEFNFVLSKSGMSGLYYGKGHFEIGAGEAAIVEMQAPDCPYWSFQLMNHWWESLDFHRRQTSINGHQAEIDPDGVFRAVISLTDPGVPNWLDPAGHARGLICGRVLRPAAAPEAGIKVVPLSELRDHLPETTRRIEPPERSAAIRRRMLSVMRRQRE